MSHHPILRLASQRGVLRFQGNGCDVMLSIDVRSNISNVRRQLSSFQEKFLPIATAKALTFTAEQTKVAEQGLMTRVFQAPTRWTLNGIYHSAASVRNPVASVYFKDFAGKGVPAGRYLKTQIEGGERKTKSSERQLAPLMRGFRFWVPGVGANLNANGNMRGGDITRIMSQLRVLSDAASNASSSSRSKAGRRGIKGHFVPAPNSRLAAGVYRREGTSIKPVMIFVKQAQYQPRFPFYTFGTTFARRLFPIKLAEQLDRELRRAFSKTR